MMPLASNKKGVKPLFDHHHFMKMSITNSSEWSDDGLCVRQYADLLPPGHCQIPQIHQQPAEDAAADSEFTIIYHPLALCTCALTFHMLWMTWTWSVNRPVSFSVCTVGPILSQFFFFLFPNYICNKCRSMQATTGSFSTKKLDRVSVHTVYYTQNTCI